MPSAWEPSSGAPFMLSTLAMFVTGTAIVLFARGEPTQHHALNVDTSILGRDVGFFVVGYTIAIGTAFLPTGIGWLRWVIAALLLVIYAVYVRMHFTDEAVEGDADELNRCTSHACRASSRRVAPGRRRPAR